MKEWYETHFQDDYLNIYEHRNEQKAAKELATILTYVPLTRGMKALDLCCGHGRHARWLARQGIRVIGVDLSVVLLKRALDLSRDLPVSYMHADVRNISFQEEMDLVLNLFTSFGYFIDDDENELIITRASEALKKNGTFVFDYLNPAYVKQHLVPKDETVKNGLKIVQRRYISGDYIRKKITIVEGSSEREYEERVKMYEVDDIKAMMKNNGFVVDKLFGDYDASPFDASASPRMIIIAKKG